MANKITHVNWHAAEEKCGKLLKKHQVCILLGISESELDEYYKSGLIATAFDAERTTFGFPFAEVKYFAETQLGIKDSSYEAGKEEAKEESKNQATTQPPIEDFFTSTCSSITKRIAEAQELAEKNGSTYGLSYLLGCFEIASSSIKKYIQTQQKGGK